MRYLQMASKGYTTSPRTPHLCREHLQDDEDIIFADSYGIEAQRRLRQVLALGATIRH